MSAPRGSCDHRCAWKGTIMTVHPAHSSAQTARCGLCTPVLGQVQILTLWGWGILLQQLVWEIGVLYA